jgi:hypothetical protein
MAVSLRLIYTSNEKHLILESDAISNLIFLLEAARNIISEQAAVLK